MKIAFKACLIMASLLAFAAQADEPQMPQGKEVYQQACARCHDRGLMGAPRIQDKEAMQALNAKGKEALYRATIKGVGRMPPKGRANISDDEAKAATDYMVSAP